MQAVNDQFHTAAQGAIVPLDWGARISFAKTYNTDVTFGTYDVAHYDDDEYIYGTTEDNPISYWDYYLYENYTDRVISMEWSREIEFPYSVSAAMADFTLNNFDDYFTPDSGSPIDAYILPKRPVRLLAGYKNAQTLQQFIGITEEAPIRDDNAKTVSFHALDFLSEIFKSELRGIVAMQDVTTDVVLDAIFQQFGLEPGSYVLAEGRNVIPFVFFDVNENAGTAIRNLMQAEGGKLWIDEQGVIRFEPRIVTADEPVMVFDNSNVIDIKSLGDDNIINWVKITSDVREVQPYQPVYSNAREPGQAWSPSGDPFVIDANSSRAYLANLEDPCLTIEPPTLGEGSYVSWFTAITATGTEVLSYVTVTSTELRTNEYEVVISNTNSFPIEIDQMELWGEPAKVINQIRYEAKDAASIAKYEPKVLEINNNFFGNYDNCDSFAEIIIESYKEHDPVIEMSVKGDFSLQLGDVITVNARSFNDTYRITAITNVMSGYSCTIRAQRYDQAEWGIYDVSHYDDGAVYVP